MHVLFLEVDTEGTWAVASIGPGFIASYLRRHGHRVSFLRVSVDMDTRDVIGHIEQLEPDLLGLSLTSRQWLRGRELVSGIRRRIDVPVVAGGLHPTFSPEQVLASPGFDYVCLGEGEAAMLDLIESLEGGSERPGQGASPRVIPNMWVQGGARPPLRPPFEPMDELPFIARDLLDEQPGVVHMTTQRGCPFPCTYCAARMYNQLYKDTGEYGRRRSHRNVLEELHGLGRNGKLAYVIFLDDTFTIHHPWVREFCRRYGSEVGVPFSLHARVETVNRELLRTLAEAGCRQITYGIESGSERIRREVMRRPVTNQRFIDVFRWTRDAGIPVTANYMLGLPGETRDDLQATLDLARELDVLDFGYFVFYPYPGTHLFQICREKGYLPEDFLALPSNHRESVLTLPDIGKEDIAEYYDRFTDLRREIYRHRLPPDMDEVARGAALDHIDEHARAG